MNDLISRQMAIDLFDVPDADGMFTSCGYAMRELRKSPSAQTEIIRCKDCKWCEDDDGLICRNAASWVVATDYDFGCVCAERRQDE